MIIGVTGIAMPDQIDHFLANGADAVIVKPVQIAELNSIITERLCLILQ